MLESSYQPAALKPNIRNLCVKDMRADLISKLIVEERVARIILENDFWLVCHERDCNTCLNATGCKQAQNSNFNHRIYYLNSKLHPLQNGRPYIHNSWLKKKE